MGYFVCTGCTEYNLLACQKCFDKKISSANDIKTKLLLIKLAAQIAIVFGTDNVASTLLNKRLIEFTEDSRPDFAHIRRQILGYDSYYSFGLPRPSDPSVIEKPAFSIICFPDPNALYQNFEDTEGQEFFNNEEFPIIESELSSEINIHCTRVAFGLSDENPDLRFLYRQYLQGGALTDLTIRPHNGNDFSLNDKAIEHFSNNLL